MPNNSQADVLLLKKPSAFLPLIMSASALGILLGYLAIFGVVHETDEGTAAHIFQLLMGMQVPVIISFVLKWFPQMPKQTLKILVLQAIAILAALAPVFFFEM